MSFDRWCPSVLSAAGHLQPPGLRNKVQAERSPFARSPDAKESLRLKVRAKVRLAPFCHCLSPRPTGPKPKGLDNRSSRSALQKIRDRLVAEDEQTYSCL